MYVKLEPSGHIVAPEHPEKRAQVGCWVGVMCRFYLEEDDDGYDDYYKTHYVYIPKDSDEYQKWEDTLPRDEKGNLIYLAPGKPYGGYPGEMMWQLNPFHNHRFYIEPDTTDEQILNIAEEILKQSAAKYIKGRYPAVANTSLQPVPLTAGRLSACEAKMADLKGKSLERIVAKGKE